LGQYLEIGLLIGISALGSRIPLIVPPYIIGLLGIVQIVLGAKRLVQIIKKEDKVSTSIHAIQKTNNRWNKQYLSFWLLQPSLSNGGDNIRVYTPMFTQYSSVGQTITLIVVLMAMTGVWCIA
jgi:cadmium resistance protein CadD (predicted permease)